MIETFHLMIPITREEEEDSKGKTTEIVIAGMTHPGVR